MQLLLINYASLPFTGFEDRTIPRRVRERGCGYHSGTDASAARSGVVPVVFGAGTCGRSEAHISGQEESFIISTSRAHKVSMVALVLLISH
jgi:hypothetical protein